MDSSKPYLLQAFYDWIVDNDKTVHIVVRTDHNPINVPEQYIEDNKVVLNISPEAVTDFRIDKVQKQISFFAMFNGQTRDIIVSFVDIEAIYAAENGKGMMFHDDDDDGSDDPDDPEPITTVNNKGKSGKPHLTVVK